MTIQRGPLLIVLIVVVGNTGCSDVLGLETTVENHHCRANTVISSIDSKAIFEL